MQPQTPHPLRSLVRALTLALVVTALTTAPQAASFPIGTSGAVENDSAIAVNAYDRTLVAAYLDDSGGGGPQELAIRRHLANGVPDGPRIFPFTPGYVALGRPDIAFNPATNRYLVAVPDNPGAGARVRAIQLTDHGTPLQGSEVYPLASGFGLVASGNGNTPVRVTPNTEDGSFLITFQLGFVNSNQLWAQVVHVDGTLGTAYQIGEFGTSLILSHSVAFAPHLGGRYLVAYRANGLHLKVLNADGEPQLVSGPQATGIPDFDEVPFDYGEPHGSDKEGNPDVAFGRVDGVDTWLVVWSDMDNCRPHVTECATEIDDQWTGIWGGFVDPTRTFWPDDAAPSNVPFPISKIGVHYPLLGEYKPRAHYDGIARRFFVVWREVPFDSVLNDESRSHIRLGEVARYVDDGANEAPLPPDNTVISPVSGSCVAGQPCYSDQDPDRPDLAPTGDQGVAVIWHQDWPPNPADKDVYGAIYRLPPPSNDAPGSAPPAGGSRSVRAAVEGTTYGATSDVTSTCVGFDEDDVWYSYTAPAYGAATIDTCGTHDRDGIDSNFDTVLSLHDAQTYGELPGACNDDALGLCGGADQGLPRDSSLTRSMTPGETVLVRVARYGASPAGDFTLNVEFQASLAGELDGLRVEKAAGGQVRATWGPSCAASAVAFDVYEGQLGQYSSHLPAQCGATGSEWTWTPQAGNRYFLAVPSDGTIEGSYGRGSDGVERTRSAMSCRAAQQIGCP